MISEVMVATDSGRFTTKRRVWRVMGSVRPVRVVLLRAKTSC